MRISARAPVAGRVPVIKLNPSKNTEHFEDNDDNDNDSDDIENISVHSLCITGLSPR